MFYLSLVMINKILLSGSNSMKFTNTQIQYLLFFLFSLLIIVVLLLKGFDKFLFYYAQVFVNIFSLATVVGILLSDYVIFRLSYSMIWLILFMSMIALLIKSWSRWARIAISITASILFVFDLFNKYHPLILLVFIPITIYIGLYKLIKGRFSFVLIENSLLISTAVKLVYLNS
jgi:hypothetical protein